MAEATYSLNTQLAFIEFGKACKKGNLPMAETIISFMDWEKPDWVFPVLLDIATKDGRLKEIDIVFKRLNFTSSHPLYNENKHCWPRWINTAVVNNHHDVAKRLVACMPRQKVGPFILLGERTKNSLSPIQLAINHNQKEVFDLLTANEGVDLLGNKVPVEPASYVIDEDPSSPVKTLQVLCAQELGIGVLPVDHPWNISQISAPRSMGNPSREKL